MQKYIALLRGVNVGGKNHISMQELKKAFEENGFSHVTTYINSGNIIFSCIETQEEELSRLCETLIFKNFHLNIGCCVLSAQSFLDAFAHVPAWWNTDKAAKHNAIFVIPPANGEEIVKEAGAIKPEYERISHYEQVIFWSAPIETFSRTRFSKIVGTSTYGKITIRNGNTANKLLALLR